jgi:hypothetical protein
MLPLLFALLGDSFVLLDVDPSILFLAFSLCLFWVLWFIYHWQGFITLQPLQTSTIVKTFSVTPLASDYEPNQMKGKRQKY